MTDGMPVELRFVDEDPAHVQALLTEIGATSAEPVSQSGFTGLEFIVLAFIVKGMSSLVAGVVRDWKCGVIVDAREQPVVTRKSADLPRGDVLIISPEGVRAELHEPKQSELDAMIKNLIPKMAGG